MSTKYNLTETQVRHLAIICFREQGSNDAGVRACASHMCNYYEKYQRKNFRDVYECTFGSGWYRGRAKNEKWVAEHPDVPATVIDAVRDVIVSGNRSLPGYVDEYDCLSDIRLIVNDGKIHTMERERAYVLNRDNYHKDKTLIENRYADPGERYTFYCFPDGVDGSCDAFGYLNKSVPPTTGTTGTTGSTSDATTGSSIPDRATTWAEGIAADQSHGYSQADRWGPNYDCSSLVIEAYIKAGVPIDKTKVYYTGNMDGLKNYGFKDVTKSVNLDTGSGLQRGDVLYYHISGTDGHTALYCGNGKIVHARGQSYGSPQTGDQGSEIAVTNYSRSQWQYVLRYGDGGSSDIKLTEILADAIILTEIKQGAVGAVVSILQSMLDLMGYKGENGQPLDIDGEYGANTAYAVAQFQRAVGLTVDGICGKKTWTRLKERMKA